MLKYLLLVLLFIPLTASAQVGQFLPFLRSTNATITNATTTSLFSTTASSTKLFGSGLFECSDAGDTLNWNAGVFTCGTDAEGSGGGFSYTPTSNYGVNTNATSTIMNFTVGLHASSTSHFVDFDFFGATGTAFSLNGDSIRDFTGTGLSISGNALTCTTGTAAVVGCLATADWSRFNNNVATTSIDTLSELETLWGGINVIQSTEIDTMSELEAIVASSNILINTEIDTCSEFVGIMTGVTGTCGSVVLSASPTFTGNATFAGIISPASSTLDQLTIRLSTTTFSTTTVLTILNTTSCAGASGNALNTDVNGKVICASVSATAAPAGLNTQFQYNDSSSMAGSGGLTYQKTTGKVGFSDTSYTYAWGFATTTFPQFRLASTTGVIIFEGIATSSHYNITYDPWGGARFAVGTSTNNIPQDNLYAETINTGDWHEYDCFGEGGRKTTQNTGDLTGSVISATLGDTCGDFSYIEDAAGVFDYVVPGGGGMSYIRIRAGTAGAATAAGDGAGLSFTTAWLTLGTSTPKLDVVARLGNFPNGTSTTAMIGFLNTTGVGADYAAEPTAGVFFMASSTQSGNWSAVCKSSNTNSTIINTGVATTTTSVAGDAPRFQHFRIEASSSTARFYIWGRGAPVASTSVPVATCSTLKDMPLSTTLLNPVVSVGTVRARSTTAGELHVQSIKARIRELMY